MKKLLIALTLIICIFSASLTSFATETDSTTETPLVEAAETDVVESTPTENSKLITELYAFTGILYYCDYKTDRVVLKSIVPAFNITPSAAMAKEAEYMEIAVAPDGLFMPDGTKTTAESLNIYADSEAWFIIARTADGNLLIPYFCFK